MHEIREIQTVSHAIDIFVAGARDAAVEICRAYCLEKGLCVHVVSADYVFTGGMESGVKVGLINYPRFPSSQASMWETALDLGRRLIEGLHQTSASV